MDESRVIALENPRTDEKGALTEVRAEDASLGHRVGDEETYIRVTTPPGNHPGDRR